MNELIREFEKQCWNHQANCLDAEKFAQMIVFECTKVIVFGGYRNSALGGKHPLTPPEIATMIKEHFGVKL
jgi:hypothetical protein